MGKEDTKDNWWLPPPWAIQTVGGAWNMAQQVKMLTGQA